MNSNVIQQYQIELFFDTNHQRGRQTRPKHHTYKDHVYLDRLFLLSNLTWRRAHVTAGLTGMDPNVKVNVLRCFTLTAKSLTLICIYDGCNAILLFTSRKINLDFCSAFEIRSLVESSYIKTNDLFQYQTRTTEWFDIFSRMHFVRVLCRDRMSSH